MRGSSTSWIDHGLSLRTASWRVAVGNRLTGTVAFLASGIVTAGRCKRESRVIRGSSLQEAQAWGSNLFRDVA
ncbi:hypothetical protein [Thermosporothrix hazakensis]|uniref:hypothetical protein n=1 Tax=Thermosporothrix hazakensis TaxID=644383 RepID=UPI0010F60708|nr:hypothetical protein [Thermosporothrix hazakensis]